MHPSEEEKECWSRLCVLLSLLTCLFVAQEGCGAEAKYTCFLLFPPCVVSVALTNSVTRPPTVTLEATRLLVLVLLSLWTIGEWRVLS